MTLTIPAGRTVPLEAKSEGGFQGAVEVGAVNGVTGTIAEGEQIVVGPLSGESFGAGPSNEFYVGSQGKTPGNDLVDGDQEYGTILSLDALPPQWQAGGLYSKPALRINDPQRRMRLGLTPTTEVFLSAWVRIDAAINTFGASYKMFWLADGDDGFAAGPYDIVLLTKQAVSPDRMAFSGNQSGGNVIETGNGWVPSSQWFHFSGWLKDNGASEMGVLCQIAKSGSAVLRKTAPDTPGHVMLDNSTSTSISRLNVMGDSNANNGGDVVPTFIDHFYVATGANARARVEIGNAANYDDCTELFPCTVSSWITDGDVTATIRHPSPSGKYLHIHNGSGVHEAGGTGRAL